MITRLDRYIGRAITHGTLWVLAVLVALFVVIVLVDVLPDYGQGNFGLYELVRYIVLSQPRKLYELFPVAILIGSLSGLAALGQHSELVVMRAAGLSRLRIGAAALKTTLLLVLAVMAFGEYVVPTTETLAQTSRAQAIAGGFQAGKSELWLRDGAAFVRLGEVLPDLSLLDVHIYEIADKARLGSYTHAARARYEASAWRLIDVERVEVGADGLRTETRAEDQWRAELTPNLAAVYTIKPEALSIAQLAKYVEHLHQNGQDARRYELALWQKVLLPLATAVMVLLAISFAFQSARRGGFAQHIFWGVMLGLLATVLHRSFGALGIIYGVAPALAAAAPLAVLLLLALVLMRRSY